MSTGKARELAREAVRYMYGDSPTGGFEPLAEYAVNLALDAACKAVCVRCGDCPPRLHEVHGWIH